MSTLIELTLSGRKQDMDQLILCLVSQCATHPMYQQIVSYLVLPEGFLTKSMDEHVMVDVWTDDFDTDYLDIDDLDTDDFKTNKDVTDGFFGVEAFDHSLFLQDIIKPHKEIEVNAVIRTDQGELVQGYSGPKSREIEFFELDDIAFDSETESADYEAKVLEDIKALFPNFSMPMTNGVLLKESEASLGTFESDLMSLCSNLTSSLFGVSLFENENVVPTQETEAVKEDPEKENQSIKSEILRKTKIFVPNQNPDSETTAEQVFMLFNNIFDDIEEEIEKELGHLHEVPVNDEVKKEETQTM